MIERLLAFSIRNRRAVVFAVMVLAAVGVQSLLNLPIDAVRMMVGENAPQTTFRTM